MSNELTVEERQSRLSTIFGPEGEDGYLAHNPNWDWNSYFAMVEIPKGRVEVPTSTLEKGFVENKYPFKMASTLVTQQQFHDIMGYNPSESQNPNKPVTNITFYDVALFCNRCSMLAGVTPIFIHSDETPIRKVESTCDITIIREYKPGYGLPASATDPTVRGFRPPTVDQFHFAALGAGDTLEDLKANASLNEGGDGFDEVALKQPNGFGLFDCIANGWIWTNTTGN